MKSNKIDASFIQYAADILGDTNTGLTGGEIVKYCNSYAIEFNVNIPICLQKKAGQKLICVKMQI